MTGAGVVMRAVKAVANLIAVAAMVPSAATCWLETRVRPESEDVFRFWTNVLAILPGGPGVYLRRAFYYLTLRSCSLNCWIGFGALFSHRTADVADEVYIGPYAVVGSARLQTGCLIGTRVSLLSGLTQHELRSDGRWAASDTERFREITVGAHAWIGEAAVVMADVGAGSLVGAGSVVSAPVPPRVVVAGNPARFVRPAQSTAIPFEPPPIDRIPEPTSHLGFVDWLKCLGILVIVYGHVAAWAPLATLPPIYAKQLGVAFFVFVTAYSLSRETRDRKRVLFNRLFEVYLFGGALALILSAWTYLSAGRLQLSNYAPLLGGANVVFDFFPANPTTWYVGTYLHIMVLWALVLHRLRVSAPMLIGSFLVEVAVRALLIESTGRFVAYMVLPNWLTVLLLGYWYGQRRGDPRSEVADYAAMGAGIALVSLLIAWSAAAMSMPFEWTFPSMRFTDGSPIVGLLTTSMLISTAYVGVTWLAFTAVTPLEVPRPVRFVSRHTLIIFLAHMPVVFALDPLLAQSLASRGLRSLILLIVCVPGLALVSAFLHHTVQPRKWRDEVYARLTRDVHPLARARRLS